MMGREMIWSHVAHDYMDSFQRARRSRLDLPYQAPGGPDPGRRADGPARLEAGPPVRMSDSAGILQHATYTIPNFSEGYCTDDNARALLLTILLEQTGRELGADPPPVVDLRGVPELRLRSGPAAVPQLHELRPDMARGSRLGGLPGPGALGPGGLRAPIEAARPPVLGLGALRPGAAGAARDHVAPDLGVRPARRLPLSRTAERGPAGQPDPRHPHRTSARELRRLRDDDDWCWFEDYLTYDNARLSTP